MSWSNPSANYKYLILMNSVTQHLFYRSTADRDIKVDHGTILIKKIRKRCSVAKELCIVEQLSGKRKWSILSRWQKWYWLFESSPTLSTSYLCCWHTGWNIAFLSDLGYRSIYLLSQRARINMKSFIATSVSKEKVDTMTYTD